MAHDWIYMTSVPFVTDFNAKVVFYSKPKVVFGKLHCLRSAFLYNFGKKVCLLPKLYLSLQRNQSTSEDVYSKTNIGVCGMA